MAAFLTQSPDLGNPSVRASGSEPNRWSNWARQHTDWLNAPEVAGR